MTPHGNLRVTLVVILCIVVLYGLFKRDLVRDCYSFLAYVLLVLATQLQMLLWPDIFWTGEFWHAKEAWLGLIKLVLAIELSYRIFGLFPGALEKLRMTLFAPAVFGAVCIYRVFASKTYAIALTETGPALASWTTTVLALTGLLALHYELPMLYLHRALLFGFVVYLGTFATGMNLLRSLGILHPSGLENVRLLLSSVNGWAYILLVGFWGYAVHRREPDLSRETLAMIAARA